MHLQYHCTTSVCGMNLLKLDNFNERYVCISTIHSSVFFSPICPIYVRYIQATLEGSY